MKSLVLYSTIAGGFYSQSEALEKAVISARTQVGDDVWKKGFSGQASDGATAVMNSKLKEANISPVNVEGNLKKVSFVENKDTSGNLYPKLRVEIEKEDNQMVLSIDLKSDVAQRLIAKLDKCSPDEFVKISAWATPVEKGERTFINHAASVRDENGQEIKADPNFSSGIKRQTDNIEATLKAAGINDNKVIANAKATKRADAHKEVLMNIQERFKS